MIWTIVIGVLLLIGSLYLGLKLARIAVKADAEYRRVVEGDGEE